MDRWSSMRIFVKVAEEKGFAEAARQLNLSPPAVTRAIAFLEEITGARLFVRTTRNVKLTDAGERYLADCQRILTDIAEAEALAGGAHAKPTGSLSITAPVIFGNMFVMPILTSYLAEHTEVTGRTLFVDRLVNIVDEGVDVAVRIGHLQDSGLSAIRVGTIRRVVCASREYLDATDTPVKPEDLQHHTIIATVPTGETVEWQFIHGTASVSLRPRLFCNTNEAALSAALAGWGITRVLSYQIAAATADGRLKTVLTEFSEPPLPVHVVHPEGRMASAKTRAFVDLAVERLRSDPALRA
ncbi:DNA-binding transcriptional LysR family regulator [Phyllobacterium trifolii]|uniref:DNA-binding transcriptional LysR family regulator n=1 Tax=Phyllobacterium trifolii TaxID=300193 RepID=A0A839UC05_9HYPH|nr:LysR family transcriptional regulator [Phyllobacterium trifolii]MBB3148518.1 DNA-binding transcriptional LysR family regulator [Phyllobacterium trifolii]